MYDVDALIREPALSEPLARSVQGALPTFLRSVKIKLTARCNLRCEMCRYGKGLKLPELPTERWLQLIDEFAQLGCRKMHLSGGEVMIRDDLEVLLARAKERRMKVTLTSNLTLLTKPRAKRLMRLAPSGISTSLDGANKKTHDAIRGIAGSFSKTLKGLELLARYRRRERPRVRVNFVMMRHNFREYPNVIALAAAHGACDVVPMPVDTKTTEKRLTKRLIYTYNDDVAPLVARARQAASMCQSAQRVYPFGRSSQEISAACQGDYSGGYYQDEMCYAPYLHMFVAWSGEVFLCCMTNGRIAPLGDLSGESVADVFRGERFQSMREAMRLRRLDACHACDMFLPENEKLARVLEGPMSGPRRLPLLA